MSAYYDDAGVRRAEIRERLLAEKFTEGQVAAMVDILSSGYDERMNTAVTKQDLAGALDNQTTTMKGFVNERLLWSLSWTLGVMLTAIAGMTAALALVLG